MQVVNPGVLSSLASAIRSAVDVPWIAPLVPGFNPDDLFGDGDVGGVFDVGRMDLCYQDLAGTIPVTAVGQTVLSIRARNNPSFLLAFNPIYDPVPCIYALDPQGYPYLFDPSLVSTQWTVYGLEDAGAPTGIDAYTAILCGIGTYDDSNNTLGAGSTVIGDTTGVAAPYSYSGVYAEETPAGSGTFIVTGSLTADATTDTLPYSGESLDARPFVFAVRVTDNAQTMQINLNVEGEYTSVEDPYPAPVGIRVWVGARGGWYGGVVIGRWLDDTETLQSQEWSASLSGISLSTWTPAALFGPGQKGDYVIAQDQYLFQTRAGPTVPVTAPGQTVQWVNALGPNARTLARPLTGQSFERTAIGMRPTTGIAGLTSSNTNEGGFAQSTQVMFAQFSAFAGATYDALTLQVQNTIAFGGGYVLVRRGTSVGVVLGTWVPPDQSPVVVTPMAIPDDQMVMVAVVYDEASATQLVYVDDAPAVPVTIPYSQITPATGSATITSAFNAAAETNLIGSLVIDRALTRAELMALRDWYIASV